MTAYKILPTPFSLEYHRLRANGYLRYFAIEAADTHARCGRPIVEIEGVTAEIVDFQHARLVREVAQLLECRA